MSKKKYSKPTIVKIQNQMSSKYGMAVPTQTQKVRDEIEGVTIDELVERHGSPLYVYSEKEMIHKYRRAYEAFSSRYPDVQFAWSYKTNYLKAICQTFHKLGSIAEVVSDFEYRKARNMGIEGKDIIFNGPHKPMDSLETAALEGAKIHIDHFDEISDLEQVSRKIGRKIPVALRVTMDTGIYPQWSKFGFNIDNGQAFDAIKRIHAVGLLEITGIHSHIGTFVLDAGAYGRAVGKIGKLARELKAVTGRAIDYVDLGGGFASLSHLKGIYQPPEVVVPDVESYAEALCCALLTSFPEDERPRLYLETGRHMVDEAGWLVTTVSATKSVPDGRRAYILDAGVNLLYTSTWYNYTVEIDRPVEGEAEPTILYGPLCMNIDVVEENVMLPPLPRGTHVTLSPVGAYNVTQAMQFIHCRPAVVMIDQQGDVQLIRRVEKMEDIELNELLPN